MKLASLSVALFSAVSLFGCAQIPERAAPKGLPTTAESAKAQVSSHWTAPALTRQGSPMLVIETPATPPQRILSRKFEVSFPNGVTLGDIMVSLGEEGYSVVVTDPKLYDIPIAIPYYRGTLGGFLTVLQRATNVWFSWEDGAFLVSAREPIVLSLPQDSHLSNEVVSGLKDLGLCVRGTSSSKGVASQALSSTKGLGSPTTTTSMYGTPGYGSSGSSSSDNSAPAQTQSTPTPSDSGPNPCEAAGSGASAKGSDASAEMLSSAASWQAGMLSLYVRPREFRRAILFLRRITQNAAIINLQVAMVDVALNQNANKGIDWSNLQFALNGGHSNLLQSVLPTSTSSSSGTTSGIPGATSPNSSSSSSTGTSGDTGTSTNGSSSSAPGSQVGGGSSVSTGGAGSLTWPATGIGYLLNDGTIRGVISNSAFSMIGFLDFLDTYGNTKTLEDVMLKTVTGNEVELKSVTEIPYVSGVGVGSTLASSGETGDLLGSANTSTANDGIILKMSPSFDAASNLVSIDMALSVDAVLGFNQLSAGNQIGTLTQPTTAERTFNDLIRVRPGQTVVVGGVTYDEVERDDNVPLFLPDAAAHQTLVVSRETMFIVLRPTVTLLGAMLVKQGLGVEDPSASFADQGR